jgi:phage tail-like protein
MPQPGQQPEFYRSFQFSVEIQGVIGARFQEASGLDATTDVIEYRDGGTLTPRKLPGLTKHANLMLKRGYTEDDRLWLWYNEVMTGTTERIRRTISLIQLDMRGEERKRWNLYDAFPVKYTAPGFNAKGNELSIETVEIAYERVERG